METSNLSTFSRCINILLL